MTLADRDNADYHTARDHSLQDLLIHATVKSGLSAFKINSAFKKLTRGPGRLNMKEFVAFGLYDPARFPAEEQAQFLSNDLHWPMTEACNPREWNAAAEDKILAATLLKAGDVPVPRHVAILGQSPRIYPGLPVISTAEALRDTVLAHQGSPIFGKIVDGMVSFGAFRIVAADDTTLTLDGQAPMTYAQMMQTHVEGNVYLLQTELRNHAAFAPYASALATVRMVNLVRDDGVDVPMALIKLPQGDNIADAFWRPGNLACGIDVGTGRIRTVARQGIEIEYLDDHPETPGLTGLELPLWQDLLDINARAARIFAPIRYQSTDIAITPDGPVVVELNYGGSFDLPQYANRRGMLTPDVRRFFEDCGYDFDKKPRLRFNLGWS